MVFLPLPSYNDHYFICKLQQILPVSSLCDLKSAYPPSMFKIDVFPKSQI